MCKTCLTSYLSCYIHKTSLPPPLAVIFRSEVGSWWFLIPRKAMPACMCALGPTWLERKTAIQLNWLCLVSKVVRPVTTTFNHKMWRFFRVFMHRCFPSGCPALLTSLLLPPSLERSGLLWVFDHRKQIKDWSFFLIPNKPTTPPPSKHQPDAAPPHCGATVNPNPPNASLHDTVSLPLTFHIYSHLGNLQDNSQCTCALISWPSPL